MSKESMYKKGFSGVFTGSRSQSSTSVLWVWWSKLWCTSRLKDPRATLSLNRALNSNVSPRTRVPHCTGYVSASETAITGYSVSVVSESLLQESSAEAIAMVLIIRFMLCFFITVCLVDFDVYIDVMEKADVVGNDFIDYPKKVVVRFSGLFSSDWVGLGYVVVICRPNDQWRRSAHGREGLHVENEVGKIAYFCPALVLIDIIDDGF